MKLQFDLMKVSITEFGVGRDDGNGQVYLAVPVDADVQNALRDIVAKTWEQMQKDGQEPAIYEPSEKHEATEYLYIPINSDLAASLRDLHEATNLHLDVKVLAEPTDVFCYFTRLTDKNGRRLTALRRAAQFKGILKSRGRLIRLVNDALQIVEDQVFKLDSDFDLLVDSINVHVLRPSAFEFAGKLQEAVLAAVPHNITAIQKDLSFVSFSTIQDYAAKHPRAARYLASIRSQKETKKVDKAALKKLCKRTGVDIAESDGQILVDQGHEMGFLEVLDRRRYELELVKGAPERFRAMSRQKIEV
jgi:hypothetical protein